MPTYLLRKSTGELEIVTGTEPFTVTPACGAGVYDIYRLDNAATVTLEGSPPADVRPPVVTNLTVDMVDNQAALLWSTDEASGTAYWVCTTTVAPPSATQIKAGQDAAGGAAHASGAQAVLATGAQSMQATGGLADGATYAFHLVQEDASGNTSGTLTSTVSLPAVDTTAAVLSAVQATLSGTTATLRWSTDEASGTSYWVCTTSQTAPGAAQIIAGEDHAGRPAVASGIQTVSAVGVQPDQNVTGLAAGTYVFHLIQRDASGNISARVSTAGVTVAGSEGVSAQISIFSRSQHQLAPDAISMEISVDGFEAQGPANGAVYNPQYHELYYFWDFGDDYRFAAPENLIDAHRNSGVGYGPKVSHTYRAPGTYTVSCLVVEPASGRSTTAVLEVAVVDPETVFAGLNTIFVSPGSDFSDSPGGARRARSLEEAFDLIGGTGLAPKRIMLNRGEVFAYGGRWFGLDYGSSLPSTHVVAGPGGGANPRVVMADGIAWNDKATAGNGTDKDFIWQNIDLEGPWDSVSETGANVTAFTHFDRPPRLQLFDGCAFDGFEIAFYAANNDPNIAHRFVAMNDCTITNWRSYGVLYGVGVGLALTGTRIACHPQASAGGPQDGQHNNQGPLRFHVGDNLLISNCDFFNRIGWSSVGPYQSIQPCVRQNVSGNPGFFSNIQASSFEGGAGVVEYTVEAGLAPGPINAVLEKCYLLANHQSWGGVRSQQAGLTVRNNIVVFPSADRDATIIDPMAFVEMAYQSGGSAEAYAAPVRVYNNTYVNLMQPDAYVGPAFAIPEFVAAEQFSDVRSSNNLIYQPHVGVVTDGPLETAPALWAPREAGYRTRNQGVIASTATPSDTVATFRPQEGSDALGDALNGDVALDDFFGNQRPQYAARGAREA